MEEKVGLWENLVIFSLEFSDNPAGFLVSRIKRFVVEHDSIYMNIYIYIIIINIFIIGG